MYRINALLLCLLLLMVSHGLAQEDLPAQQTGETASMSDVFTRDDLVLRVFGDSLNIRSAPSLDAEPIGSAFEDDNLYAIGRNVDGSWFEVRRPGRQSSAGWVSKRWVSYMFDIAELPITDLETGVVGPAPVYDSGVDAFILTEAAMRNRPSFNGEEVGTIPASLTIPVIERSPDNLWLHVNYLGNIGWVAEFLTRIGGDINDVPISPDFSLRSAPLEVIPVEVQLAQLNRMSAYITPLRDQADSIANFWSLVTDGEVVPCNPPSGGYGYFALSGRDVVELPELRRYRDRLSLAVNDLNASIDTMQRCGVYNPDVLSTAYAQAINARLIFKATLQQLDNLEAIINS